MSIPVYVFTGFLESGKTTFIQDTLEDKRFNSGDNILLILCEEGEKEYCSDKFSSQNVKIINIDSLDELNENKLSEFAKSFKAKKIVVEYNGMWQIQSLYDNMPEDWVPCQNMMFVDTPTFKTYNSNMRSLVVDKLSDCDVVVFNRIPKDYDTMDLHKIVRGISRRSEILYEFIDGTLIPDEIEDPLPFDINAPVIKIEDRDYAYFYTDLTEDMKKYKGKTVEFKALAATDSKFPENTIVLGRHIMICCADDTTYCPLVSKVENAQMIDNAKWYMVVGKIDIRFSRLYGRKGPVLYVENISSCNEPKEPVTTFY